MKNIGGEATKAIESINEMINDFYAILPNLLIGIIVFIFFYLAAMLVRRFWIDPKKEDLSGLRKVIGRLSFTGVLIVGVLISVTIIIPSITPAKLFGALGFGSVAIGFAFKDILQNFLAGLLILIREPFKKGDQVKLGDFEGTVQKIDTRSTFIKTYDGLKVLIPNGQVYTNPMIILTAYESRRSQYDIGIGYGDDVGEASKIILNILKNTNGVLKDPAPDVLIADLAASSVNLRARWWTDVRKSDVVKVESEVMEKVKYALDEEHIDMPYPTQVHLFHDQTEEVDGDRTKQREGWPVGSKPPKPRPIGSSNSQTKN